MSFPNKVNTTENLNNTVYFTANQLKISYSSLEVLKGYLIKLFNQDIRIEEKLKQIRKFFALILKELYKKGILKEDHTMVITDPIVRINTFSEALEEAYKATIDSKITITKPSKTKIIKRRILTALFIKKEHPIKDFYKLISLKGSVHSTILNQYIDLENHAQIKFKATKELEEYIINILTRTALLSQGCSIYTLNMYIEIIIELVIWYARGLAIVEKTDEASPTMLSTAISLVDNHYITIPAFIKMLQGKLIGNVIKILN
ncbi:MAG: hypothetical protein AB7V50_03895 [Vampirovibrionia bacterium]